ncbi:MAG TPA: GntR family transcriptional regulator [Planctomycetota bacterium]
MKVSRKSLDRLPRAQTLVGQTERILREAVAKGHFPGNKLPPAVELAAQLGVSRETVRQAEAALERDGLLTRYRRKGTLLKPPALSLKSAGSRVIGYLQADYWEEVGGTTSALMLQGALREAGRAGYQLAVRHAPPADVDRALRELQESAPLRGIIFASVAEEKLIRQSLGLNVPAVLLDHDLPLPRISSVREDSVQATRLAVDHLASLGHRRIAYAHWRLIEQNPWRVRGYQEGLRTRGLPRRKAWELLCEITPAGAAALVTRFLALAPRPSALICYNNTFGQLVHEELRRRGVKVPDDLSLIGAGGESVPGLSSLVADWDAMGRAAVKALLRAMKGPDKAPEHQVFAYTLHRGRTTAPPSA